MEEFRGGASPSGKSTHPNYKKKFQDSGKRWWEKPLGIIILGILVTVIGGLILWGVTRHYDKPTPSTAAAQPTTPPQPQAAQPESKPQENTQPQSTQQRSGKEKKVKIEQHGEGNGAVGGSITTGPCSIVQNGGTGNTAASTCTPPPLKLAWTSRSLHSDNRFQYRNMVTVTANIAFQPVSLIVICDQEIKDISAAGLMYKPDFAVTQQSNKIGYVYYESPALAPGVDLAITVSSTNPFSVLDVRQEIIKPRKNVADGP